MFDFVIVNFLYCIFLQCESEYMDICDYIIGLIIMVIVLFKYLKVIFGCFMSNKLIVIFK